VATTGYGDITGLCGVNCRHNYYPVIPGVNKPTYTEEQLANIDKPPFEYQGKKYTAYEATQKMRQLERAMRKSKDEAKAFKEAGLDEDAAVAQARTRALSKEYKQFSQAAGLREQPERTNISYVSNEAKQKATELAQRRAAEAPIRQAIRNGEYPLTINPEKQSCHMAGTATPGRSIITISQEELQEIINAKAGSGKIEFQRGSFVWTKKEIVDAGREIGYTVRKNGDIIKAESIKIHYSKTGTHAVPRSARWKK
jgi:hypothetical protein